MRSLLLVPLLVTFSGLSAPAASGRSAKAGAPKSALPFVEDDYASALAEARAKKIPIFAEAWAPW